jgi:hypothetical protein
VDRPPLEPFGPCSRRTRVLLRPLLTLTLLVSVAGCGGPGLTPARTLPPGVAVPPAEPLPDGRYRIQAASGPVEAGVPYEFTINAHCGLQEAVIDFDASLWDPVEPLPTVDALGADPIGMLTGTMTLHDQHTARFRSATGARFMLSRTAPIADVFPCD